MAITLRAILRNKLKYDLVVGLCRETEVNEQSFNQEANLFVPENLSMEDLMQGYEKCNAYAELKEAEASKEAIIELKTILHENYEIKMNRLQTITQKYLEARQGAELVDPP